MILVASQSWLWRATRQLYTATARWEPKLSLLSVEKALERKFSDTYHQLLSLLQLYYVLNTDDNIGILTVIDNVVQHVQNSERLYV